MLVSRSISPPVKHAALSSVSSIVATIASLNQPGPFWTAVLGPTVASDFVEPYMASGKPWSSTAIAPTVSSASMKTRPIAP